MAALLPRRSHRSLVIRAPRHIGQQGPVPALFEKMPPVLTALHYSAIPIVMAVLTTVVAAVCHPSARLCSAVLHVADVVMAVELLPRMTAAHHAAHRPTRWTTPALPRPCLARVLPISLDEIQIEGA